MSSEPVRQPDPRPRPRRRQADDPAAPPPDQAPEGARELGRARGYVPDDPATWPGNAPEASAPLAAPAAGVEAPSADGSRGDEAATLVGVPDAGEARSVEPVLITDPTVMRAMAHPLRIAISELFNFRETLTATEASEILGESPANCAFHLRTLAKYGFLREAGGGRGRERPWTPVNRSIRITTDQPDPQANIAAGQLSQVMLERWFQQVRQKFGVDRNLPGWERAQGWSRSHLFLTAQETRQLMGQIMRLLERYESRLTNPEERPVGALPVEWSIFATPLPEYAAQDTQDTQDSPDTADPSNAIHLD